MRKTSRVDRRRVLLAGAALALFLAGGAPLGAQQSSDNEGFLVGVLLKTWTLRERTVADIQMNDQEIVANNRLIEEADKRMSNAQETFNDQEIFAARDPLMKARAAGRKLKQARARLELAKTRAEATIAAVRNLLVSGQAKGLDSPICGLAFLHSGKVKIVKKDGRKVELDSRRPGFLGPGDELMTMGGSSAEVQVVDGLAAVQLGEHSRFKLEEVNPQEQVPQLLQGKIYCNVDKPADFAAMLEAGAGHFEADPDVKETIARNKDRIKERTDKKFIVRTPGACGSVNGTKFTMALMKGEGTEIAVLEGEVNAGNAECAQAVLVEHGFKVIVTKDSISEPQKVVEADKWWEK